MEEVFAEVPVVWSVAEVVASAQMVCQMEVMVPSEQVACPILAAIYSFEMEAILEEDLEISYRKRRPLQWRMMPSSLHGSLCTHLGPGLAGPRALAGPSWISRIEVLRGA